MYRLGMDDSESVESLHHVQGPFAIKLLATNLKEKSEDTSYLMSPLEKSLRVAALKSTHRLQTSDVCMPSKNRWLHHALIALEIRYQGATYRSLTNS